MNLTAALHGGPRDGELIELEESVPYELAFKVLLEVPDPTEGEDLVLIGSVIYRRRGGLDTIGLGTEATPYDFIGPAKRGSRR